MTRQKLREIKNLDIRKFEQVVNEYINEDVERKTASRVNLFLTSFMLAFIDRYPDQATADILHSIAVDTVEYTKGIEPASELAARLLERTGFDIYEQPSKSTLNYIPKGENTSENHA